MKNRMLAILGGVSLIVAVFAGCTQNPSPGSQSTGGAAPAQPSQSQPAQADQEKLRVVMPTGSMGGSYYNSGTVVSELVNTNVENIEMSIRAGGSQESVGLLDTGEVKFAMAAAPDYVAVMGNMPKDSDTICSMMVFNALYTIPVVPGDSTANSLYDLKGKKLQMGDRRTGQYLMNASLLDVMGLGESDFKCEYMAQGDAATAFNEGKLDGNLVANSIPSSILTQLATNPKSFRILQIESDVLTKLCEKYPYYFVESVEPDLFPEGTVKEPVSLFMQWGEILVRSDVDEEIVYQMTKTLCENHDQMVEKYKGLVGCTAENSVKYTAFNLHPGAERYYKEIGLIK